MKPRDSRQEEDIKHHSLLPRETEYAEAIFLEREMVAAASPKDMFHLSCKIKERWCVSKQIKAMETRQPLGAQWNTGLIILL